MRASLFTAAAWTAIVWTASAQALNTSREFNLRTQLKAGQESKADYDGLWLYAHHTGAGMNDAMFTSNRSHAIPGFLNATGLSDGDGQALSGLVFDLGSQGIPWSMLPALSVNFYAAWQPVRINAGGAATEQSAFWINGTGLQWTNAGSGTTPSSFGGWYVCQWWHGSLDGPFPGVQLFFRVNGFGHMTLETCADVDLVPEYL